jgi:diguanylate cyclase (GGDEF)-like protein/PAS domain S-box-containing protein
MDRWLNNLSLFKQLVVPMFIVGLLAFVAAMYSAVILEESISALNHMHKTGNDKIKLLEKIDDSLMNYQTLMIKHLATENASAMLILEQELQKTRTSLNRDLQLIHKGDSGINPQTLSKVDNLYQEIQYYFKETDEIKSLSADFEKELAFTSLTKVGSQISPSIANKLKQLRSQAANEITLSSETLVSAVRRNLFITITIGVTGGFILLAIAFMVIRRITKRLSELLAWSNNVSKGDWTYSLNTKSKDEVGRLTLAMEDMSQNIQRTNSQLAKSKLEAEDVADELRIYANAFENSGEPILISDENNNIININKAFTEQTGYTHNDVIGHNPKILSSGTTPSSTYEEMWQDLDEKGFWQGELWDKTKSGTIYPKLASISAIKGENNQALFYIASFADISERKEAEERISHLAHHDILTGLQNRFSLEDRLEQALSFANRDHSMVAVFFIDLDRFKNINDSLGHHAGDKLLIEVSERLKKCVRESDIVARIGGDEFVIVLTAMHDTNQSAAIAESLLTQVSRPYFIDEHKLETSPSIGISIYPSDGSTVDELMRNADIAMYHAKEEGRNTYHFFTDSMLIAAQEHLKFQAELRAAIENQQLELHYQPQMNLSKQCVSSLEALVRWRHPDQGMIPPDQFIPVAEETGFIHELGEWVFNEACKQLVAWRNQGLSKLVMAINLSAKQLHSSHLSEIVSSILKTHGLHGHDLELEITETAAMVDPEVAVEQLDSLRKLGVGLAIDDFGTGYSSLAYLKRLPIQTLKLDRAFVGDIEHDQNDLEISTATISLAHNLGLKVVAEGVETKGQLEFLVEHQCDYVQGYYFSKPLSAHDVTKFLKEKRTCVLTEKLKDHAELDESK